jgi:hypothetical protein
MANRKIVLDNRSADTAKADDLVLASEIEATLVNLDKVYNRNISIFDKYEKTKDFETSQNTKKSK